MISGPGSTGNNLVVESQIEEDNLAYQRRQKMMVAEVAELGESIELKEQLLGTEEVISELYVGNTKKLDIKN